MQNLDEKSAAMASSLLRQLKSARQHLAVLAASPALQSPTGYLEQKEKQLEYLKNRLISAQNRNLSAKQQRYIQNVSKLDAMSPLKVLTRGYAMAENASGELVRSIYEVENGDTLNVRFCDGLVSATVVDKKELNP